MSKCRVGLPFADWPAADRAAWDDLFRTGNPLDGRGAAVHWAPATRKTNRKHYARWLGCLAAQGRLDPACAPRERATPAHVEAYADSLLERVALGTLAPCTVASALIGLKCVVQRMAPEADWRWLKDLTNRLDRWAQPSREHADPGLPAPEMFRRVLVDLERQVQGPLDARPDQLCYRDTLIVAIFAICPLRLRNMAMMRLGKHLVQVGSEWHLRFDDDETKTGQPLHLVLPEDLTSFIDRFLERVRPELPGAAGHSHVWPACKRRPMAMETIYARVRKRTRELFGVPINPHAFRSIAATFLAESSPKDALYARPLLGHRQGETTERHYIRARQMDASRRVSTALRQIRDA